MTTYIMTYGLFTWKVKTFENDVFSSFYQEYVAAFCKTPIEVHQYQFSDHFLNIFNETNTFFYLIEL